MKQNIRKIIEENISKRANKRDKERRKTNPIYKCRKNVSGMIYIGLKKCNSYKNKSSWENLPYTPSILKQYIESQFSLPENLDHEGHVWMTWRNWGKYNAKIWNEKDSSTWSWNLDHIIPQSKLPYDTMEHPNFLKCWDLSNLRPYPAKLNIEDGNRRK